MVRPLDLAQNVLNQAQQAQQRLGEQASDAAHAARRAEQQREDAAQKLKLVQQEQAAEGKVVREDEQGERPKRKLRKRKTTVDASHADETPEGKGRRLDVEG